MAIVVVHEGRDGPLEMLPIQDQQPIEALSPNGSYEALRDPFT
jgi:hypothetical protein